MDGGHGGAAGGGQQAFLMGNALVVGVVRRLAPVLQGLCSKAGR